MPCGMRRVSVFPRSNVPMQADCHEIDPTSNRWMAVISSGVNVIIDNLNVPGRGPIGKIDLVADRLVIWTSGPTRLAGPYIGRREKTVGIVHGGEHRLPRGGADDLCRPDVLRRAEPRGHGVECRCAHAAAGRLGAYQGKLRLHADVLQQTAADRYFAQNAFLTSSRMGTPGYRLQAGDIYFQDLSEPVIDPMTGQPMVDPSGQPVVKSERLATASNDLVFIGPVPVFYWPVLATDLNDPSYYIRNAQLNQDNIYGTQVRTHWNGYELLGIRNKPIGTDFDIALDYLSQRGFGYGGTFSYDREGMFGIPGHVAGLADFYAIQDRGTDNLGQDRTAVPPEATYRYRLFGQHREICLTICNSAPSLG